MNYTQDGDGYDGLAKLIATERTVDLPAVRNTRMWFPRGIEKKEA